MVAFYRVIFFHFPPFDFISCIPFNLSPLISTRARPFETVLITSPRSSFLLVALFLSLRPFCSALSDYCGHGNTKGKKHPSSVFALFPSAMLSRNCSASHRLLDVYRLLRCPDSTCGQFECDKLAFFNFTLAYLSYILLVNISDYVWLQWTSIYLNLWETNTELLYNISSSIFLNTYYFLLALTKRSFQ